MTDPGRPAWDAAHGDAAPRLRRGPSDDELAAILRRLARLWLEVERGYRPPSVLQRFLAPHLFFELENAARKAGAPPVGKDDVGGSRFQRIGRRHAFGVVVIREAEGHWAALMLALLRDERGGWRVVEIERPTTDTTATLGPPTSAQQGGTRARG